MCLFRSSESAARFLSSLWGLCCQLGHGVLPPETSRSSCLPHLERPAQLRNHQVQPRLPPRQPSPPASPSERRETGGKREALTLKAECAMAPGKAAPRGCLRPGPLGVPLGRVRTGASVSTSAGPAAIFTARQREKCSRGGGLHQPPAAHSAAGDPRVREPLPLPDVISSRAKVGFSFPVGFPTHTADRINPRKWLLCEVWVPEMRVTQPGSPLGASTSAVRRGRDCLPRAV